jgi:CubicO group peptidase (beta-lactamase class C family)
LDRRIQKITIRHLLHHSSGLIRDGKNDYWITDASFPSKTALRTLILNSPVIFDPGTQLKYSNLGYALLGELISEQVKQPYEDYVAAHILQPLNSGATFTPDPGAIPTGYGLAFNHKRRPLKPALHTKALVPVTGLYASPADMCTLAAALYDGQSVLLSEAMKHTMRESKQSAIGYDYGTEFGLGLEVHCVSGRNLVGHSGHISGNLTATIYDPRLGVAVSVAANAKDAPCVAMVRGILGALYYFLDNAPQDTQCTPFAVRLCNDLSTIEIVQSGDSIAVLDPDDWDPFAAPESAERINDTTLRIITPGSVFNFGELIEYTFSGKSIDYVRFAGMKISPDRS